MYEDNDGRFPDDSPVEIRYPRSKGEENGDRSAWPWLPGRILEQCGPDEWYVRVEVRQPAVLADGRRAPRGTASRNLYYPCCYRDGSEMRPRTGSPAVRAARWRGSARMAAIIRPDNRRTRDHESGGEFLRTVAERTRRTRRITSGEEGHVRAEEQHLGAPDVRAAVSLAGGRR